MPPVERCTLDDDLNYTLIDLALGLGGVVASPGDHVERSVIGYTISEYMSDCDIPKLLHDDDWRKVAPKVGAEVSSQDTAPFGGLPLSTAHISPFPAENAVSVASEGVPQPFVEWWEGAGLLKISRAEPQEPKGGGKRKAIHGFSRGSRRRMMQKIGMVRLDSVLPVFITLTYPAKFPEPMDSKRHLDIFIKRLRRRFHEIGGIWKLEPQERGAPHYHFIVWGVSAADLFQWTVDNWFDIAGDNDRNHWLFHMGLLPESEPCVEPVRSVGGVKSYASKYLGKTFDVAEWGQKWTGRFWAVFNPSNIPFGEHRLQTVSRSFAVQGMRYQKRYAHYKRRDYPSLTIFCTADYWVNKLSVGVVKGKE